MLHHNYTHYIGRPLIEVEQTIRDDFFGNVVIYTPGQRSDADIKPTRLQVFVDEQNVIVKIVNG